MLLCARIQIRRPQSLVPACLLLVAMLSPAGWCQIPADDLGRLAHPDVAERLGLSDQQMVEIQRLLQARTEALADAENETQRQAADELSEQIRQQLTAEQAALFQDSGPTTKLKFQFRDQKWSEVLEWFSRQEGLTLVMDRSPPGTFTYSDTRSYTASQAIDLLNSVLLTRGFTLIRREKMLLVQPLGDSIPTELIPLIKLSDLPARGKFELVRVEFGLGGRPIDAVLREVTPYLGNYGRAIPLPQSGQLVVIESAGKMEMINRLISSVPVPKRPDPPPPRDKPPEPVFAAYGLGQLDPISTLETIRKLIPSEQITVDPQTRVLSAFLVPGQQQAIQSAIEKMQQDISQATPLASAAFSLGAADSQAVREQLTASFPRAVVNYDPGNQRLLVTSDTTSLDGIKQLLEAIGVQLLPEDALITATLPITEGTASSIALSLQQLLPTIQAVGNDQTSVVVVRGTPSLVQAAEQIVENLGSDAPAASVRLERFPLSRPADTAWLAQIQRLIPKAQLWLTPDNQQLLAWAGPNQLEALADMLPAVSELLPEKKERQLETYRLDSRQRAQFESMLENLTGGRQDVRLLPGTTSGDMLIWATEQQHREIAEMVQKLHTLLPAADPRLPKLYRWELRETTETIKRLREQFPDAQFELDAATNQLTVWADDTTQPQISQWIERLTERLPPKPQLQLATYGLPDMPASRLQTILGPLLSGVQTTVDLEQQRLLVWGTPRQHQEIQELVDQLAEQPAVDQQRVLLAYQLQHADVDTLRLLLESMLEGATLVVDQKTKQLLATATLPQHAKIKTTLAQLDQPGRAGDEERVESFAFRKIQAVNIIASLSQLWPDVKMTVDPSSNTVVASGPQRLLDEVRQAVERMNRVQTDEEGFSIRTYPAPGGDLRSLPGVLSQIAPEAIVSADWANRTLVVWGSQRDQERVSQALEQLNQAIDERQTLQIYSPPIAQSEGIRTTLTTLFPRANITSLGKSGQLAVMASPDVHQRVADVLEKLAAAGNGSGAQTRILPIDPEAANVATLYAYIQGQLPTGVTVWPLAANNSLLAIGPTAELDNLEQLVAQLGQVDPSPHARVSATYRLQFVDMTSCLLVLRPLFPTVTFSEDRTGNSITAIATPSEHQRIAQFLEQYDVEAAGEVIETFYIPPTRASSLIQTLAQLFPGGQVKVGFDNNRLIVRGPAALQERVKELMDKVLAEPEDLQRNPQSYAVPPAMRAGLATLIQSIAPAASLLNPSAAATNAQMPAVVLATADEHADIKRVLEQVSAQMAQADAEEAFASRILPVDPAGADVGTLYSFLSQQLPPGVTVWPLTASNSLLATGPPQQLDTLAELIAGLEQTASSRFAKTSHVYRLEHVEPTAAVTILRAMLPAVPMSEDRGSQTISAVATAADHQRIADFLADYDVPQAAETVEVYFVPANRATGLLQTLAQVFPVGQVKAGYDNGRLIVRAAAPAQKRVAELMLKALAEPGEEQQRTARSYSLPPAIRTNFNSWLTSVAPSASLLSAPTDTVSPLLVLATPEEHREISRLVDQLTEQLGELEEASLGEVRNFPIDRNRADVASLALSLRSQMPASVTLTPLVAANTLLAAGPTDQLDRLAQQLQQLQQPLPESFRRQSKVYNLRHADPLAAVTVLRTLSPAATVAADSNSRSVAATATADEHRSIEEFLRAYDVLPEQAGLVRVYRVTREDPRLVAVNLKELLPAATVSPSRSGSTLIVTASELEHQQIEQIIGDIERRGGREEVTRSYSLLAADPRPLQTALAEAFPEATLAADSVNGELIATASESEHTAISAVVDDLNASGGRRPRLRSFVLQHLPASAVAEALQQALGRRSQTGITADDALQLLLVLGPPSDLELAEQLVEQIDQPTVARQERRLKTFTLSGFNGSSIADSIRSLLENQRPEAEINFDPLRQKLVVIGTSDQLQQVEETLQQFVPTERELELFRLKYNEPQTVRSAINSLFTELPLSETPTVTVDESLQQVLVRATAPQLEQVRQLLVTLGEPLDPAAPAGTSSGRLMPGPGEPPLAPSTSRVRRIPVRIDPITLQRELERRWPATGRNRLEWVQLPESASQSPSSAPGETDTPAADPPGPKAAPPDQSDEDQPPPNPGMPANAPPAAPIISALDRAGDAPRRTGQPLQLVSTSSVPAVPPSPPSPPGAAPPVEPTSALDDIVANESLPPILIIPGSDGLTIASEDTQALDALQRLLEAMQEPQRMAPAIEAGNVSLYLLKNSGAEAMEQMLNSLFRRGGDRGRGDRELGGSLMRTTIVADSRTNALVISGPRADRKVIEEIISVLDDERLVGSLQLPIPRLVPVRNTNAERIEAVLREVYRSQMTAGGRGRRPITIPEGVSAEVQSVLQQINIEATSPLLTVAVDETSNSLIIRAPMELSREVVDFINELDNSARSNQTRRTDIITLETMNSRQLEQALDILQRRGGGGGRSGRRR
jgi:type II secretory pathway component GspD/PulD (secretin)